jgi:hypothetical protein
MQLVGVIYNYKQAHVRENCIIACTKKQTSYYIMCNHGPDNVELRIGCQKLHINHQVKISTHL